MADANPARSDRTYGTTLDAETNDWKRWESALEDLLDLAPEDRKAYLEGLNLDADGRAKLEELLAAAETEPSLLRSPVVERLGGLGEQVGHPGEQVGPYRLLEPLGRGGMGSVFLAQRVDGVHSAKVAVKILSGSWLQPGIARRFHAEREILAALRHPSIARLLDGGTTDTGRPYLVMEWVDGLPVDRWCRETDAGLEKRLRLMMKVCAAVQSAHQNLVVHRDLKPGNILVEESGEPKLLDFGIAKLLDDASPTAGGDLGMEALTAPGMSPLTPGYASPEQIQGGQITTATDVYALGVLLYQLLCGRRPHEIGDGQNLLDLLVAIREQEPSRPSTVLRRTGSDPLDAGSSNKLARKVRGDLDQIVLQALAKDPAARYASAAELGADIGRFLDGLPVAANAATAGYRLRKFVARHRLAVAFSSMALALLLGSLTALLVQRRATLEERDRAELTTRFLVDQLHDTDPLSEGPPRTLLELLEQSADRLAAMDAPAAVRADLQTAMGRAFLGAGDLERAHDLLRRGLDLRVQLDEGEKVVETLLLLSNVQANRGRLTEAQALAQSALDRSSREQRLDAQSHLAYAEWLLGRHDQAEPRYREVLSAQHEISDAEMATATLRLGSVLMDDGRYDEAEVEFEKALKQFHDLFGADHPRTARVLKGQGVLARLRGDFDRAREIFNRAERVLEASLQPDHPSRLNLLIQQARVESQAEHLAEAQALLEQVLESAAEASAQDSPPVPEVAEAKAEMGFILQRRGELDAARQLHQQALEDRLELYGEIHHRTAESLEDLAILDVLRGRTESALDRFQKAFDIVGATLGADHPVGGINLRHQGNALARIGRYQDAMERFERARSILEPRLGQSDAQVAALYNSLGFVKHRLGDLDGGRRDLRQAIQIMGRAWGEGHMRLGTYRHNLARLELEAGNVEAALAESRAAQAILAATLGFTHAHRRAADIVLARCLMANGAPAEAKEVLHLRLDPEAGDATLPASDLRAALELMVQAKDAMGEISSAERQRLATLPAGGA